MKPLPSPLSLALGAAILLGLAPPALAAPFDNNPKILLHLKAPTLKNVCNAGLLSNCQSAVTEGDLSASTYYFAYVLGAKGSLPSMAAVQFGVQYQQGCGTNIADQKGVDILSWTTCGSLIFNLADWPRPGTGALITWDPVNTCQTGETAVAGYFYVGCYDADILQLVPRPVDNAAKVVDCNSLETEIPPTSLGFARFSAGGATPGCNPCDGPCVPAGPITCGGLPDMTPPDAITDLAFVSATSSTITIGWTVPDDNPGGSGVASYIGRRSTAPITPANFDMAEAIATPQPAGPGMAQTLTSGGINDTHYFALKSVDHAGNVSAMSNLAVGTPGGGSTLSNTSLLIHLSPVISNPALERVAGQIADCEDAVRAGGLLPTRYYAYLLAADFGDLGGLSLGITYDNGQASGQLDGDKLDIFSWTLCATLQFMTPGTPMWPAPGGGNLMVWDSVNACQVGPVAVAGFFYVGAYGPDELAITFRPVDNRSAVVNCQSLEYLLSSDALGSARFSVAGNEEGYDPCDHDPPVPVQPTTWSRLKVLAGTVGGSARP